MTVMALAASDINMNWISALVERDGYKFLRKECVGEAENVILSMYQNVYVQVEDSDIGRSKFMVGNLGKKVCKPKYEIYISIKVESKT